MADREIDQVFHQSLLEKHERGETLTAHELEMVFMRRDMEEMKRTIADLAQAQRDLLVLWQQATGVLRFIKFVGMASGALLAVIGLFVAVKTWLTGGVPLPPEIHR